MLSSSFLRFGGKVYALDGTVGVVSVRGYTAPLKSGQKNSGEKYGSFGIGLFILRALISMFFLERSNIMTKTHR